jgi:hypothetical protein
MAYIGIRYAFFFGADSLHQINPVAAWLSLPCLQLAPRVFADVQYDEAHTACRAMVTDAGSERVMAAGA